MNKIGFLFLCLCSQFFGFEKLDSKYWVRFGQPDAEFQAVEYFSLSCPKCLDFYKEEFPAIREKYIESGTLSWAFHPDPADLLTLQAMICLERLPNERKILFLDALMGSLAKLKDNEHGCKLMQTAMEVFQDPVSELGELEFLEKSQAFQDAFEFVSQKDVVKVIPSIEIDGILYKEFPTPALIDAHINNKTRSS